MAKEVYIIRALRTPIGVGKPEKGWLSPLAPVDLVALVLHAVMKDTGLAFETIDDVILGCVTPIGDQGANIARLASLKAGFPVEVPGVQLNRMCGSGKQAVHFGAQAILAGDMDLVIGGGIEMMSHQAIGADWPTEWPTDFPYPLVHQGISAEMMAEKWSLSRDQLDDFAFESHRRAAAAIRANKLADQILPVEVPNAGAAATVISQDQGVRMEPDRQKMASLAPAFKENGVVTAGNSSQISDGAAALLLASDRAVKRYKLEPLARIVARAVVGSDPVLMLDAPIPATRRVLSQAGLSIDDVDFVEINEAFASVVLAWVAEIGADLTRVNINGGAIAHGHPLGATGAVLMTKLVHELKRENARYGLQTMCIGHGMATATILELM
ncbi:MAG: thiolase family protein [Anaerolineales bacterium]|nr:MAG: thiolase family protein [Anaerolineales bacterium]